MNYYSNTNNNNDNEIFDKKRVLALYIIYMYSLLDKNNKKKIKKIKEEIVKNNSRMDYIMYNVKKVTNYVPNMPSYDVIMEGIGNMTENAKQYIGNAGEYIGNAGKSVMSYFNYT